MCDIKSSNGDGFVYFQWFNTGKLGKLGKLANRTKR